MAIFQTQNFCMGEIECQSFKGVDFLSRAATRFGVYLEFCPGDFTLGSHLDKAAGRFRKHDFLHMGDNEASRRLRNSYSEITDIITFYRTSDAALLGGKRFPRSGRATHYSS